jgi:pimeloyl-ACP methyl ester carboxylesterase
MVALLALAAALAVTPPPEPRLIIEPVHENAVVGDYSAPADGGRHPAILIIGGFQGRSPSEATALARHGYSTFALAYFGGPSLPKSAQEIPVELVSHAIDWLLVRPEVDPAHVFVLGISQGSQLALLAAARERRIRAVAVISPSAYVWFAPAFDGAPDRSSWSLNAAGLPFIRPDQHAEAVLGQTYQSGGTYAFRDLYDASLAAASPATVAAATIPVERIAVPILCIAGDDDRQWDSAGACKTIAARRRGLPAATADEVAIEPGAGHANWFTGRPTDDVIPAGRMSLRMGGTIAANVRAAGDIRSRTLTFFSRTI